ncbi:transcriptional regulator [Psychromonas sp. Urea-02u-13]|uniref:transcriptional regulator n=1 Tax=Psychromonas sp. Urea-02u-13 TaxID=2058326 RepID=UPI0018E3AD2D|nr:transcriptional regulator [Psychromonas sp. Urea-02u-13]
MSIKIKSVSQLGQVAMVVRRDQSLDQETAGLLSGCGSTFISRFEHGKESSEIGRVLSLLEQLGVEVKVTVPKNLSPKAHKKLLNLGLIQALSSPPTRAFE